MPKANNTRSRRTKRKRDHDGDNEVEGQENHTKRRRSQDGEAAEPPDFVPLAEGDGDFVGAQYPGGEETFFGLLDEQEQTYFKQVHGLLEDDAFGPGERDKLLEEVWRESDGKELKIAQSQSCSRLLERLIQLSTASQLKNLFQKFSGQYVHSMPTSMSLRHTNGCF